MTDAPIAPAQLTVADATNRGYNLLAATMLLVVGLAFSELIVGEPDPLDKVDNLLLLVIGVAAVAWFLAGSHRYGRSAVPIAFSAVALGVQVLGIGIEIGDPSAVGDDFGGLTFYLATLVALVVLYRANGPYVGRT